MKSVLYLPHLLYQTEQIRLPICIENLWYQLLQHCCRSHVMFVCMCKHVKQHKILEITEGKKKLCCTVAFSATCSQMMQSGVLSVPLKARWLLRAAPQKQFSRRTHQERGLWHGERGRGSIQRVWSGDDQENVSCWHIPCRSVPSELESLCQAFSVLSAEWIVLNNI